MRGTVKGIYFQWSNEPTNPVIKDWNVTEMRVSRRRGFNVSASTVYLLRCRQSLSGLR
jgi:hypothetical protein